MKNNIYGLIGKDIGYSFSKNYFSEKFKKLAIKNSKYQNFDLQNIEDILLVLDNQIEDIKGLNVTIPYKQEIIQFLDELDDVAKEIGAVNTIKISPESKLIGYNTDAYGFENSIKPLLKSYHKTALILGTGGASKAIKFVLNKLNIASKSVSRNPSKEDEVSYVDLNKKLINESLIIINCTPLGTYPNVDQFPVIPYQYISENHILFDLIYNPSETEFLRKGKKQGAQTQNGLKMLELQAEKSWEIWNNPI